MRAKSRVNASSHRQSTLLPLLAIYVVCVSLHVLLLWRSSAFPFFASDAVQYAMTGDNLRLGKGYTLRGHFNESAPPLYPAFVAIAHSLAPEPHVPMLLLSNAVMCLALFPMYKLAVLIGVRRRDAVLLGAAAALLPHTFYAAMYMAESVQYPLFLAAFYLAFSWLTGPDRRKAILLGLTMGLMLLNKWQAAQFIVPFFAVAGVAYRSARRDPLRARAIARQTGLMFSLTTGMCLLWLSYKAAHSASALGQYSRGLAAGFPQWSWPLAGAYAADFLLAPGLVTAVPIYLWMRATIRTQRTLVLFAVALLATQLVLVSTIDGGLTGWLRERLFLYCFPISAVLAVRGMDSVSESWKHWLALAGVPILLGGALMLYPFHVPTALETPWAFALGTLGTATFEFSTQRLLLGCITAIAVFAAVLFRLRNMASTALAAGILIFQAGTFVVVSLQMERLSAPPMTVLPGIRNWLASYGIVAGSKLFAAGRHNYFEPDHRGCATDAKAMDVTWRFGLPESTLWAIETLGRYDVRTVQNSAELAALKPGDYFLTIANTRGLELVGVHYPYALYKVPAAVDWARVGFSYGVTIPRGMFRTISGPDGSISLAGPSTYIPAGAYQAVLLSNGAGATPLRVEMPGPGNSTGFAGTLTPGAGQAVSFRVDGSRPLEFRISGPNRSEVWFDGIELTPVL